MPETASTTVAPPKRSHHEPLNKNTKLGDAFEHPEFISRIKQAVPKHMTADRMLAVFIQAVRKTPKLRDVDTMSLLGAFISVASVGLEPNTALQHAHLIPFDKRGKNQQTKKWEVIRTDVNVIFGYQGLLELAYRSGLMRSVHADVAWKNDEFDFHYGSGAHLRHKPMGGMRKEGELPEWAYMHANMRGEAEAFECMPISDVLRVRDSTQAYASALTALDYANKDGNKPPASYTEAPWVKHFVPMAKKTVFRAGSKWLPKSIELASAIALDELQERHSPNYGAVIEGSANVLDGGLDALPDDFTGRMETDIGGAFSMQDERQGATVDAEQGKPAATQQQRQAAPPATQTTTTTQKSADPEPGGFGAYLVDQWGEMIGDLEHTNATDFARALQKAAQGKSPEDVAALIEANAEGVGDAMAANSVARNIITGLTPKQQPQQASEPASITPVELTQNGRGAAWPPYIKALKESLGKIDAAKLADWTAANIGMIRAAPNTARLTIVKVVTEHAVAVGGNVPAAINDLIAPPQSATGGPAPVTTGAPTKDADERWVDDTIVELSKLNTVDAVETLALASAVKQKMQRLKVEKRTLFDRADQAFADRMQALEGTRDPEPEDAQDFGQQAGDPGPG